MNPEDDHERRVNKQAQDAKGRKTFASFFLNLTNYKNGLAQQNVSPQFKYSLNKN